MGDTFKSFRTPNFRRFILGQTSAHIGTWMQTTAFAILVLRLTDNGIALALVTIALYGPILLVGPWAGALSDRLDSQRLLFTLAVLNVVAGMASTAVAALGDPPVGLVLAAVACGGTVFAVSNPARRSFVNELVRRGEVVNAVALNSSVLVSTSVMGPLVAGVLIAGPGITWAFGVAAALGLPYVWSLATLDRSALQPATPVPRQRGQIRAGFHYAWHTADIRNALLIGGSVTMMALNSHLVLPLLVTRDFGRSDVSFTVMMATMSTGAVIGCLALARWPMVSEGWLVRRGLAVATAGCVLAVTPTYWIALGVIVALGVAQAQVVTGFNAYVQLASDPVMRGRALAVLSMVTLGTPPVAALVLGSVAEGVGARWALVLGATVPLVAAVVSLRSMRRRQRAVDRMVAASTSGELRPAPTA